LYEMIRVWLFFIYQIYLVDVALLYLFKKDKSNIWSMSGAHFKCINRTYLLEGWGSMLQT